MEYSLMLPDSVVDTIFNDQSLMEMLPNEETLIETEDLDLVGLDTPRLPDEGAIG